MRVAIEFISGALMVGFASIGVVFLRYWRQSNDRLFRFFAVAFFLMAFERVLLQMTDPLNETRSYVFLLRLVAFILIIIAIVDKNRGQPRTTLTNDSNSENR